MSISTAVTVPVTPPRSHRDVCESRSRRQHTLFPYIYDYQWPQHEPDWIFIMWPNPPLCWSASPTGPQSRQPGLSLVGASTPSGTSHLPPLVHPMAHMVPLCLICTLQLWAHSIDVWRNEYSLLYVQYTWIKGDLCVNYCMCIHYMWSFNSDWKVE